MERIAQYLDDLEDFYYALALIWERVRTKLRFALFVTASVSMQISSVLLALASPPLAMAAASLMLVSLLYRGVVFHHPDTASPA